MNRSRARLAAAVAAAAGLLAGLGAVVPAADAARAAPARTAPAPFVIIMMENHGLHPVLNDRTDMPYLNSLWRGGSSLDFTHYAALAHPSLPNYLGMASGFTQATLRFGAPWPVRGPIDLGPAHPGGRVVGDLRGGHAEDVLAPHLL